MPSEVRLKKFENMWRETVFYINEYNQKYFPCVSKTFPVLQQNSLCFPCLEKVRPKFPVFPVPWPPCFWSIEQFFFQFEPYMRKPPMKVSTVNESHTAQQ